MDIPDKRHPECPDVHLGSCPNCRRLWIRDLENASLSTAPVLPDESEAREIESASREAVSVVSDGRDEILAQAKPDRLAVAREALSPAAKQARFRKAHPDYVEREKARLKARRAKIRGSPASDE